MSEPIRIRLSRKKGFNLQKTSRQFNGLECVKVDRTNRLFGNPFIVGKHGTAEKCLELYQEYLAEIKEQYPERFKEEIAKLFNKNLACWCQNSAPCHADILLKIVKQELSYTPFMKAFSKMFNVEFVDVTPKEENK